MRTIYLFRHGEVEDHYRDRVRGGETDCLLSPIGEQMSIANAQFLVRAGIQEIITTGMKRTDYVGEYLADQHKIPHRIDARFKEMLLGEWEGKLLAEVNASHPAEAVAFREDPLSGVFPGLEDVSQYQHRVLSAWHEILNADTESVAVIAHGITNTVILRDIAKKGAYPLKQTIGCMNKITVEPPVKLEQENIILYPATIVGGK